MDELLRMEHVSKRFGDFYANRDINLSVRKGEVHTLLGENGAGKSTLMNVLIGLYQPTEGKIFLNGKEVRIDSPAQAVKLGIGMVHQHFMLVEAMTVFENIILGDRNTKGIFIDKEARKKEILELAERYGLDVELDRPITEIAVGAQQRVEILKTLYRGAELLILDEATSGLDPVVRDEVLDLLYDFMQDETHAVLLSSHITSDLDKIADNITFIHRGRVLLSEGRDELIDRHGVLRCTEEQLNALDPDAVRAVRKGAFGCEALVKRDGIPENWPVEPVSVEQIMLFLTRGEEA